MNEIEEIRRKIMGESRDSSVFPAIVTKVDESDFTCEVRRDDAVDYFDVRLRGLVKGDLQGFAFIPRLQSTVLVCRIGKSNELFVCQFTEIDKVIFTSADTSLTVDADKIEVLKGSKFSILINSESMTIQAGQATIKTTTGGLTLAKGSSGLKKTLDDLLAAIQKLTVTTSLGPSGPPINVADFIKVQKDLSNYLEG
ncbi:MULTISPECIES: hypothetical protein [Bacteroides]|jgi:hypothetical protein|uniref:hypothetical protein n=1 Tax=Bacteroides TaxID=816 RepID=UPI00192415AD|nr:MULTISPECIES: hypothetical protein [Bacteroides]MCS2363083.1 hypothetical protein [Bacteroides thetaiotaomicron]MCS3262595.1 hypothetical protein [Bacteroides thetaiotaomicron]DAP59301.1 MAG TPA: hypothetical protein [Caudoviricetes sp.]